MGKQLNKRTRIGQAFAVESLESREMLAGDAMVEVLEIAEGTAELSEGTLTVEGTEGNDRIAVRVDGDLLIVRVNDATVEVPNDSVRNIAVRGLGGDDAIVVRDSVGQRVHLEGNEGDDEITANSTGSASIDGGNGDDTLVGTHQADRIMGGRGSDNIRGRGGNDTIYGEHRAYRPVDVPEDGEADVPEDSEADVEDETDDDAVTLVTPEGEPESDSSGEVATYNDRIDGGDGRDRIFGQRGNDTIVGGPDADRIRGGEGRDHIDGGLGNDVLEGGLASDVIFGGFGNDRIRGGRGNDALVGGDGNDRISGGRGSDWIFGDATNHYPEGYVDPVAYARDFANDGNGRDVISGNRGHDVILAGNGNDRVSGGIGDDYVQGGFGNDRIHGSLGDDTLLGDSRHINSPELPSVDGEDDDSRPDPRHGQDVIFGGFGNDRIAGQGNDDRIRGGFGDDELRGGWGDDSLRGGRGNDYMIGGRGADLIFAIDGLIDKLCVDDDDTVRADDIDELVCPAPVV